MNYKVFIYTNENDNTKLDLSFYGQNADGGMDIGNYFFVTVNSAMQAKMMIAAMSVAHTLEMSEYSESRLSL